MTEAYKSMSHSKWDCKYHVVFIPKHRRNKMCGTIGKDLGTIFHALARQKECEIGEGQVLPDHVHMCLSIPPQHLVSSVVGFLKGKSAIGIARQFSGRQRTFTGENFWARGYCVSTVGYEEERVRVYIREQAASDDEGRLSSLG